MKTKLLLTLCLAAIMGVANANTYYVDLTGNLTTGNNDGSSWENAFQTFSAATAAASANPGADDVYIRGSITTTATWTMSVDNYYGSFAGTESSPSQRPMNDNDGNGIIEPWEFQYPTNYTINANNLIGITGSAAILDGFTITQTSNFTGGGSYATLVSPLGQTVQNCVLTGSSLTYGATFTNGANYGCLTRLSGTFRNNLVEKNVVTITTSADVRAYPIVDVVLPASGTVTVAVSGCVVRNNKASITSSYASTLGYSTKIGYIVNVEHPNNPTATAVFSDCIIHNNEASFTSTASPAQVCTYAGITSALTYSTSTSNESYINCVFANNKTTNLNTCMSAYALTGSRKIYNCVFWNNQNNGTAVSIKTNAGSGGLSTTSAVANNVMDVNVSGNFKGNGTSIFAANLIDLSTTNTTATNGPQFANPPLSAGNNIIGNSASFTSGADLTAISQSSWKINTGSYLIAKGSTDGTALILPTANKDKAGTTFAATPAVGAYEYTSISTAIDNQINNQINDQSAAVNVLKNGILIQYQGSLEVFSPTGAAIKKMPVSVGQLINLPAGIYIARTVSAAGASSQKISIL